MYYKLNLLFILFQIYLFLLGFWTSFTISPQELSSPDTGPAFWLYSLKYHFFTGDNTTPITSITPPDLELFEAYLTYRDIKKQQKKYKWQLKYKITIELSVVESDSAEHSAEDESDESESETEEIDR